MKAMIELGLVCKQRDLEGWWEPHWACGFASLATCIRFLGGKTSGKELINTFRKRMKGKPREGLTVEEIGFLAQHRGYRARYYRGGFDKGRFKTWLLWAFEMRHPVIVAVDGNHVLVTYSNHEDRRKVWFMDPLDNTEFFGLTTWDHFLKRAA